MKHLVLLLALLALPGVGCESVGPNAVRVGRAKYNDAIQETDKQQMLQNLVRMRYKDFPYFLEVSSILAAPQFSIGGDAQATFGSIESYGIGGNIQYSETPVIVYAPLGGENFTRRLLTPMAFSTVVMLSNAGWEGDRLWRMCVQSINGVNNAKSAGGPTPDNPPNYEQFNRVTKNFALLSEAGLESSGAVAVDKDGDGDTEPGEFEVRIWFEPEAREHPAFIELVEDLELDPNKEFYRVVDAPIGGGDTIAIQMRPLMSVMYYVSQAVEVPSDDVRNGVVTVTTGPDGEPLDWTEINEGIVRIRSSEFPPNDPFVSVRYRTAWYYIARDDIESKESFTLLFLLFTLQAGEKPTDTPLLSLPIG